MWSPTLNNDTPRPTLKTIAELTGLSLSTVSLCLRNGHTASKSTRERVVRAANKVGYVPNRAGVRLRTGRTNVLALVLAMDQNAIDFTRQLIQGIGAHIRSTKYHLNVMPEINPADPAEAVRYILENRSADGVILTHIRTADPRVRLLLDAQVPFVCHGRTEFAAHAFHDFNVEAFVRLSVRRLADKGRRHILLAAVDNGTINYISTVSAFERAIADTGIAGEIVENPRALNDASNARALGGALADRLERFDAIICNNELTALALIGGLRERNKALGRHYDLICRQTTDILPTLYPGLDTVSENLFETGSTLARLLINLIDGQRIEALQTLHEPIVHWRSESQYPPAPHDQPKDHS